MKSHLFLAVFFLFAVTLVSAYESTGRLTPGAIRAAVPTATTEQAYLLGPEDQFSIYVTDLEEVSEKPVRVDPAGDIALPLIGRIHAAGLTVEQLRSALASSLSKYINSPQVVINILEYRSQPVSILGAVNNPGVHQLQGPKHLIDLISAAGGLKPEAGPKLTITRQEKWGAVPVPGAHADASGAFSIADVPLNQLTAGNDPVLNITLCPNDVVSVSKAAVVYVIGEVRKAGGFSLQTSNDISLLRALSLAEGLTHDAAPRKARILRGGSDAPEAETLVDLKEVLAGKVSDPKLHADDILFVPNNVSNSAMKRATEAAIQIATGVVIFH